MKQVCLYFQVHQPFRLRRYRFFEIGENNNYFDEYENSYQMRKIAEKCYIPANKILLDLIKKHKTKFKVSFSITGSALEQFQKYAPEVLESFKELAATGKVEFLSETYSHSLVSLQSKEAFKEQVLKHEKIIKELFGKKPAVFRNTELIYNNLIGEAVAEFGYKAMITEGARHILGWKSPNLLYYNVIRPELKLILKNYKLSDDIAFRFSNKAWDEYPLTTEKFANWILSTDSKDETINLFMDYETFGEHQVKETGIFEFLKSFPSAVLKNKNLSFATPSELAKKLQPVAAMNVEHSISWADEERDTTAWLGNEMQKEAFTKLYALSDKMKVITDKDLISDWNKLQASDHFYYMSTKIMSDGIVHEYFNPYKSSYDAFINYMNVLSDFTIRVNKAYKETLLTNKDFIKKTISEYESKIADLKKKLAKPEAIEKTKPVRKVIQKTKKESKVISKSKPEAKVIDKTKKELKAIPEKKKTTKRKTKK